MSDSVVVSVELVLCMLVEGWGDGWGVIWVEELMEIVEEVEFDELLGVMVSVELVEKGWVGVDCVGGDGSWLGTEMSCL